MIVQNVARFTRHWRRRNILLLVLIFVIAAAGFILIHNSLNLDELWLLLFIPVTVLLFLINKKYLGNDVKSINYLHQKHSELEYSLGLLNRDDVELNQLEYLQRSKTKAKIEQLQSKLPTAKPLLRDSLLVVALSWLVIAVSSFITVDKNANKQVGVLEDLPLQDTIVNPDSAYLENVSILVIPPSYTGLKSTNTQFLDKRIPEGSEIKWKYGTRGPVESVFFHFNDDLPKKQPSKIFVKSGIYYYSVQDSAGRQYQSPYYAIQVKEDQKPRVEIKGIEEYQRLGWKENYDIVFDIDISDDYGIEDAFISATVAKGQGESVKFREKTFPLKDNESSTFTFSTKELDMEPGSELYFYVMAKDNCPYRIQATKSTTHFVVLEDTLTYDYVEDAGMQVDLMPDFFRSQRQIIIDTEKLIAEKDEISQDDFKQRSNELGFDQKMLRLKYGQFLGEEAESGIAIENEIEDEHDHDHDHEEGEDIDVLEEYGHNHDHEAEENMLLETKGTREKDPARPEWVEAMSHSHDNAEENTYFDISLKGKLKAALSVMWDSELHLRLYDPRSSLPFQYEALKYLEEIKNHARIYVHRIGFDPPAIKVAEKRLTGDQDKISDPTYEVEKEYKQSFVNIRKSIEYFSAQSIIDSHELGSKEKSLLQDAGNELAGLAIEKPALLSILSIVRKIINEETISKQDKKLLISGFIRALPQEKKEVFHQEIRIHPINKAALEAL